MPTETNDFLTTLFSNLTTSQFIETRAWPGPSPNGHLTTEFNASVQTAERSVARAVKSGWNCFVGVAPRNERSGKSEAVSQFEFLWCDVDHTDAAPQFVLPPTLLVRSGNGWHLYWQLTAPCAVEAGAAVMKLIAAVLGGDSVFDAPRVMRIPGTLNYKSDPPTECHLVEHNPLAVYSLADLTRAAKAKISKQTLTDIYAAEHGDFHSRSERDWAVMRDCLKAGLSRETIHTVFEVAPCGDKVRAEGEHYFTQTYDRAFRAINAGQDPDGAQSDAKFVVVKDELYMRSPKGELFRVATFWLDVSALIQHTDHQQDSLSATLHTPDGSWPLTIQKKAFNNATTLNAAMPQAGAVWLGSEKQSREYLAFVIEQMRANGSRTVQTTATLGRHGAVWIGTEQTITLKEVLTGAARQMYYLSLGRDHITTAYEFPALTDLLAKMFPAIFEINYRETLWPVLGWFFAAPYKPVLLAEHKIRFPHLNIFGTRGSGKTSLIHLLLRMSGITDIRSFDANTTPFVLLSMLGATNAVPISLTEFRADTLIRLNRYLLTAYDSGRDSRGRPDQTTQEYPMTAPLVLDGEDAINDPATKERAILCRMSPETILPDTAYEAAFRQIAALPVQHIAGSYIQHTLRTAPLWEQAHTLIRAAYARNVVPDRVLNNLAVVVMGMLHLNDWLSANGISTMPPPTPLSVFNDTQHAAYNVIEESGRTSLLADEFVEAVINQAALSTERVPFLAGYDPTTNTLRINLSSAYSWWVAERNRQKRGYLSKDAILGQLVERKITTEPARTGQYVTDVANLTVSLAAALASGLDIPARIDSGRVTILDYKDEK